MKINQNAADQQAALKTIDWNELRERGLLYRINNEILHPLGLAMYVDIDEGVSPGAIVADDGKWEYEPTVHVKHKNHKDKK